MFVCLLLFPVLVGVFDLLAFSSCVRTFTIWI